MGSVSNIKENKWYKFLLILILACLILCNCTKSDYSLSGGILVTFDVNGETYRIFITNANTIEDVFAVERGDSQATIPNGRLISGSVDYNEPWSWYMDSDDIHMAENTIELGDGLPSQVEAELNYWENSVKRFSPWSASIVEIEDLR